MNDELRKAIFELTKKEVQKAKITTNVIVEKELIYAIASKIESDVYETIDNELRAGIVEAIFNIKE